MAIQGFERRYQVEATIRALEHEKLGAGSAGHLASIDAQIQVFTQELERLEREGEQNPRPTHSTEPAHRKAHGCVDRAPQPL